MIGAKQAMLVPKKNSTEKQVCTVFVNQWAASGEKQDEERYGQFGNSQHKASSVVFVKKEISLFKQH